MRIPPPGTRAGQAARAGAASAAHHRRRDAIVRRSGLSGLTMRALSRRLGVSPSALYNHVPSREALLAWVQEHVSEQLDASGFGSLSLRDASSADGRGATWPSCAPSPRWWT